jgi:type IV pilus assembly protein PilQ
MLLKPGLLLLTQLAWAGGVDAPKADPPPTVAAQTSAAAAKPGAAAKAGPAATPGPAAAPGPTATTSPAATASPAATTSATPANPAPALRPGPDQTVPGSLAEVANPRLYSMTIKNREVDDSIIQLCAAANIPVEFLSPCIDLITVSFSRATLHQALDRICTAGAVQYREQDGNIVVGLPLDLELRYPSPSEQNIDAVYRCRHLDAEALAQVLGKILSNKVKITEGPRFQSPSVDTNSDPSGVSSSDQTIRALNATDTSFKIHDVILSGPGELVRRGIELARKFDRPRKSVRIDIRVSEIDESVSSNLGVSWMSSLNLSATETVPANPAAASSGSSSSSLVPGIKVGSFSHTPLTVNATINALETQGKAKTLSNPTLLLLDGERSFILSGTKYLYPKYTGKDQSGQSIFDTGELKVGIYLQVSVQIGLNNDVVMSLMPQITEVTSLQNYNNGEYPVVSTREAQTTVHAYSGEIVALGGLRSSLDSVERDGIPFLKNLPFIGNLFSTSNKTKSKSDLVIFLTPHVEDDLDHVEKINVEVSQ